MTSGFRCAPCERDYPIVDGIPDLFVAIGDEADYIDEKNTTWLDPEIVAARDTIYRLTTRELRGMDFCMDEIGRRTRPGCRILEVGMGTGHFTRWLAEVSSPGTEIYAFDFSWPIIEVARANTRGLPGITFFRANARGRLPFRDAYFDIVFARLAPLGAHGVSNAQAAYELLKPGSWYFWAGKKPLPYEVPETEMAMRHGYAHASFHVWQYRRAVSEQEAVSTRVEIERAVSLGVRSAQEALADKAAPENQRDRAGRAIVMTYDNVLIAQKPT
jgi:SAM-dependent methyltransferase